MKKDNVARLLLSILIACSLLITCINLMMLGTTSPAIFPSSNSLIVAFIWLYRAFDAPFLLILALVMFVVQCCAVVQLISKRGALLLIRIIHSIDILISLASLCRGIGIWYIVSILFDALILFLVSVVHKEATSE